MLLSAPMRAIASLLLACAAIPALAAEDLPRLNLLPGSLTVSGVSAGGYMATQYQVAHSKAVAGAGVIAAGPWLCSRGVVTVALNECLRGSVAGPEIRRAVGTLRAAAVVRTVDDPSWLASDRVWIFHGQRDDTVGAAVADSLLRFYREFIPGERIRYETQVPAAHGFPTLAEGGACDVDASPWILACGYDAAGEMLKHLYGELAEPAGAVTGALREFAQSPYIEREVVASMADRGFLFVPRDCAAGRPCRIHVAFHGCRQGVDFIGRTFARQAGYNRWADANRIVVLYPQVAKSLYSPLNPRGCWDWWGYTGVDFAARSGAQLASVRRMLAALGAN
jgi:poly(3-hydroxybutyrate) depolymerase